MQSKAIVTEREALYRAQRGDADGFEWLYHSHCPRVYALCLRMTKDPTQAEDLTQETFLAVFRGIRHFRGQSAFTTWLYRVTRNTVLMFFRKVKLPATSFEEIADRQIEEERPRKEWGRLDVHLESIADRLLLQAAMATLSANAREALVLHYLYGYEHHEIAELLGRATGTSKSRVHKANLRLRATLRSFQRQHSQG